MGLSTHVVGIKPPDQRWREMKAIWDACVAAKVAVPRAVETFFDGDVPNTLGVEVHDLGEACVRYGDDAREGFDIYVDKLPPDVKIIRVYNAW